ncbi:unnamed protein product, partial [Cladocopium goreaui]
MGLAASSSSRADDPNVAAREYDEQDQGWASCEEEYVSEQQCIDPLSMPVAHSGGQQRPLYTSALWEPSSGSEGSVGIEVPVTQAPEQFLTQEVSPTWLGPRPELLQAKPKSYPRFEEAVRSHSPMMPLLSSSSSSEVCILSLVDGLCYSHPAPGIALRQGNPGASPNAKVHPTVKNYVWLAEGTIQDLRKFVEQQFAGKAKIDNLRKLLNTVETSQASYCLIAVTTARVGISGKLGMLKALAPGGRFLLLDDNRLIGQEFPREGAAFIQIKKPSEGLFVPWEWSAWSVSDPHVIDLIKTFLQEESEGRAQGLEQLAQDVYKQACVRIQELVNVAEICTNPIAVKLPVCLQSANARLEERLAALSATPPDAYREPEDVNARAIEQALKSPKKTGQPSNKTPAVPAKASPAGPSVTEAVSSPAPPKKAGAKPPPTAKSKSAGKPMSAADKVAAAVAAVAALSSMVTPSQAIGILEGAADTGAGQHLVSYEALREQGYHDSWKLDFGLRYKGVLIVLDNEVNNCEVEQSLQDEEPSQVVSTSDEVLIQHVPSEDERSDITTKGLALQ